MQVGLLWNRRRRRDAVGEALVAAGHCVEGFATATEAYDDFMRRRFDALVIGWRVYPGFGCPDPCIRIMADMLPDMGLSENIGYWQTAVRLLEALRSGECANRTTPILITRPDVDRYYGEGFTFDMDVVRRDLRDKDPIRCLEEVAPEAIRVALDADGGATRA